MIRLTGAALVLGLACGGGGGEPPVTEETEPIPRPDTAGPEIPMPDFPRVGPGQLAVVTDAEKPEYRLGGTWEATARFCEETRALQVLVFGDLLAVGFVVGVPDTGSTTGVYRVVDAREGIPSPRTARVALQTYATDRAYSLPGVTGTVEIDTLSEVVSGRFATSVFENVFLDTVRMAGSFARLPVDPGELETCRVIGIPTDTSATR